MTGREGCHRQSCSPARRWRRARGACRAPARRSPRGLRIAWHQPPSLTNGVALDVIPSRVRTDASPRSSRTGAARATRAAATWPCTASKSARLSDMSRTCHGRVQDTPPSASESARRRRTRRRRRRRRWPRRRGAAARRRCSGSRGRSAWGRSASRPTRRGRLRRCCSRNFVVIGP